MRYTIWIIPPEPIFTTLQKVITELSQKYQGPLFSPHMTVAALPELEPAEITKRIESIAKKLHPLELSIGPVSFSTTYFQSVFARVNSTAELTQLNLDIKDLFEIENDVYMPHISLLYGNHDMKIRERITKEIHLPPLSFVGQELAIIPHSENIGEWIPVEKIPLG